MNEQGLFGPTASCARLPGIVARRFEVVLSALSITCLRRSRSVPKPIRRKEGVFTYLVLIHGLAIAGLIFFPLPSWKVLGFILLLSVLGGLGTTVCYHRTVKTNPFIEQLLIFCAVFNGSGHPASWVVAHTTENSSLGLSSFLFIFTMSPKTSLYSIILGTA